MKNIILIFSLILIAFTSKAQTPAVKETINATISVSVPASKNVAAPTEKVTLAPATAGSAPDNSAKYVGTNDLNLYLLREGVKKA